MSCLLPRSPPPRPRAAAPQPPAADASPAIFVVRDADTTVYIFGTFHALDGRSEWFNDRSRARSTLGRAGARNRDPGRPGPRSGPAVRPGPAASGDLRPPPSSRTTRMAINAGRSQGMQVGNGADMVLRHAAEAEGKPVEGLETLEFQLNMFNRMPVASGRSARPKRRRAGRGGRCDSLVRAMADMQSAWKRGDQSVFVRMLGQLEASSPDTYRMMFTERNARWADWIAGAHANARRCVRRGRRRPSRRQGQPPGPPRRARHPVHAASN